jgi:hypothetical protein
MRTFGIPAEIERGPSWIQVKNVTTCSVQWVEFCLSLV